MNVLSRINITRCVSKSLLKRNVSAIVEPSRYFHVKPHTNEVSSLQYSQAIPDKDDEIVVAMSSGVDSSVTAAIYASQYKNVRGIYMANWSQTAKCTESDWNDVQKISDQLGIPCERVNFEKEYWSDVFMPMIQMYEKGLTPNPDTGCNKYVKFGKMIEHLTKKFSSSSDEKKWWLVTGHYARIMKHNATNEYHLLRGYYGNKDQSFYLSNIPQSTLSRILMPIGHLTKPKVRELAKKYNLHIADKPDSQGLCFVGQDNVKFRDFLNEYITPNPGNIITEDGKTWGKHQGLWHATIGQKSGISMPQGDEKYAGTWFVSEKNYENNELVIVKGGNNSKLFKTGLKIKDWEWLINNPIKTVNYNKHDLTIQYRSLQEPELVDDFIINDDNNVVITLKEKARAMAPGQNIVLYNGPHVYGSGVLYETFD